MSDPNPFMSLPDKAANPFMTLPDKGDSVDFAPAMRTIQDLGLVYPALEAGAHAVSGAVLGFPAYVGGGLGTLAARSLGLTDKLPSDVGNEFADAVTYQPKTEEGKNLAAAVDAPLQKLNEAAKTAGEYVADKTGSPALAALTDAAVSMGPFAALPLARDVMKAKPDEPATLTPEEMAKPDKEIVTVKPDVAAAAPLFKDLPDAKPYLDPALDQTPLPDKAININFQNIDSADDVKAAMAKTADLFVPAIQDARRGRVSFDQTKLAADTLGMTVDDLLKRRKGQGFTDAEGLAARQWLVSSSETLRDLAAKAQSGAKEDLYNLQKQIVLHKEIQAQVSGGIAETARALNAMKITATSTKDRLKALDQILGGNTENLGKVAEEIGSLDTVQGVNKYVEQIDQPTFADKALYVWINSLLSGPQTHAVNMTSNALTQLWTVPEHLLAGGIGKLHGGDKVYLRETVSKLYGMAQGMQDGLVAAGKTLATGEPSSLRSKLEFEKRTAPIKGILGKVIGIPGRMLMAEDELFKGIAYRSELNTLAMRKGLDEGLSGGPLASRIEAIKNDPPADIQEAALNHADYLTFTKQLGKVGLGVQTFAASHPALRLIIPFVRTPVNILKFAGERTPLAVFSKSIREDLKAGGAKRDLAIARIGTGSAVGAVVAHLASQGIITGGGPQDPSARSMLYATGWQPYSIKVGDKYYAYSRLEPLGTLLGASADYAEIAGQVGEKEANEIAGMIVLSVSKNIASKTWLSGVSKLVEATTDPERYGANWVRSMSGTLIPTGVAQVARTEDPVLRRADDLLTTLKSRIPTYSKTLPPRLNVWGEPIILQGGLGPDMISPVYTSTNRNDKTSEEMVRLGINLSPPKQKIGDVLLDPWKHNELIRLVGQNEKKALDVFVHSPAYDKLNDGLKSLVAERIISRVRGAATQVFMAENPALIQSKIAQRVQAITK